MEIILSARSWRPSRAAQPFPYGGKQRLISVDLDTAALQAKGLSAVDIVNAMNAQNLLVPTGTAKLGTLEYAVEMNGSPRKRWPA